MNYNNKAALRKLCDIFHKNSEVRVTLSNSGGKVTFIGHLSEIRSDCNHGLHETSIVLYFLRASRDQLSDVVDRLLEE